MSAAFTPEPQSPSRRTRVRKLSRLDRNEIVELTAEGWSGAWLARRYNVDRSRITRLLQERGVERERYPAPAVTDDERREILSLCRREVSDGAVVEELRRRDRPRAPSTTDGAGMSERAGSDSCIYGGACAPPRSRQ
jgi:hypothetical protein